MVKKMPEQKLFFGNMVHEFVTVAEGIHVSSKPEPLKNARLEMAIKTIDRIEERLLKFKVVLEKRVGPDNHATDKLDECRETVEILRTHLRQRLNRKRTEVKREEARRRLRWLDEAHEYFKQLEEELE